MGLDSYSKQVAQLGPKYLLRVVLFTLNRKTSGSPPSLQVAEELFQQKGKTCFHNEDLFKISVSQLLLILDFEGKKN